MAGPRPKIVPDAERHLAGLHAHLRTNHRLVKRGGRTVSAVSVTDLTRDYAHRHELPVRATLRLLDDLAARGLMHREWRAGKKRRHRSRRPKWRLGRW